MVQSNLWHSQEPLFLAETVTCIMDNMDYVIHVCMQRLDKLVAKRSHAPK